MRKETLFGLLAMIVAQVAISYVPYLAPTPTGLAFQSAIGFFVSAFIGSAIARKQFALPAAVVCAVIWTATLYMALRIAQPAGGNLAAVLSSNWITVLGSLAAAISGAALGQAFRSALAASRPRATT